jgi:hypothetical protein
MRQRLGNIFWKFQFNWVTGSQDIPFWLKLDLHWLLWKIQRCSLIFGSNCICIDSRRNKFCVLWSIMQHLHARWLAIFIRFFFSFFCRRFVGWSSEYDFTATASALGTHNAEFQLAQRHPFAGWLRHHQFVEIGQVNLVPIASVAATEIGNFNIVCWISIFRATLPSITNTLLKSRNVSTKILYSFGPFLILVFLSFHRETYFMANDLDERLYVWKRREVDPKVWVVL